MSELVLMPEDEPQEALNVRLLEKEVVLVEPEMVDPVVVILVLDLIEGVRGAPKPDLKRSFVISFLGTVATIKGTPTTCRQDRVARQALLPIEVPSHLSITFEIEIGIGCLRNLAGHDAVAVHDPRLASDNGDREVAAADQLE